MGLFVVKKSTISGIGLFADANIPAGAILFKSFEINGKCDKYAIQIIPNNYVNHSTTPNTISISDGKFVYRKSIRYIFKGEEITSDYAQTQKILVTLGINPMSTGIEQRFLINSQ